MRSVDQVSGRGVLSWLRMKMASDDTTEMPSPMPSLAAVEYELMQLRVSLKGLVDFADQPAPVEMSLERQPATGNSLERHLDHRHMLAVSRF